MTYIVSGGALNSTHSLIIIVVVVVVVEKIKTNKQTKS